MIRCTRYLSILPLALLATTDARAKDVEAFNAYFEAPPVARANDPATSRGFVASVDDKRGTPTFFWAVRGQALPKNLQGAGPERIARHHLGAHADLYGLTPAALQTAKRVMIHDTGRGGVIVVFRQSVDGVELLRSDMKVLMDRNGKLVALGGALHPAAVAGASNKSGSFAIGSDVAIAKSLKDLYGIEAAKLSLSPRKEKKAGYDLFDLGKPFQVGSTEHVFVEPARAKKVYFPMPKSLVPAYYVEFEVSSKTSTDADGYAYVIAAADGRMLLRKSLKAYEAFQYRVWADDTAPYTPKDGPGEDWTPHPTGISDHSIGAFTTPTLISMEGFNTNPAGTADPWLPAAATETVGNNVDAYTDSVPPDGYTAGTDHRAPLSGPNAFDWTYDTTLEPLANITQSRAATQSVFYTINWLHDYWYDSGFNEAAGNAQADNYGRGGEEGDVYHAETQNGAIDPGYRNDANSFVPADGFSPRVQLYLYSGGQNDVTLQIGAPINSSYAAQDAAFGAKNYDLTASLVLAVDGTADVNDACEAITNNVAGKIAIVNRGTCSFESKAVRVQQAGAVGMLLANNAPTGLPSMVDDGTIPVGTVTIPALGISQANGDTLKTAILGGTVSAQMKRIISPEHEGAIDNSVVAHEWCHYMHVRLVGFPSGKQADGQGEGWGDFLALHTGSHATNNFATGTFAVAQYSTVSYDDAGYHGVRRMPTTRDMTKNPLTFKHIDDSQMLPMNVPSGGNNSEVHNTGEVWSSMMWEAYTNLILSNKHPFDEAKRRMADYVVGGMIMTPINPTFTEQRDAILAYAAAVDNDDMLQMAQGFAKRGIGSCAVSPPRESATQLGVVESYEVKGNHAITSLEVDDSILSCDSDGILDGGESGKVTLEIVNNGVLTLNDTVITLTTPNAGVIFPQGNTMTVPSIPRFQKVTATFDISLAPGQYAGTRIDFDVSAVNSASCVSNFQMAANDRIDVDDISGGSTVDTVDSEKSTWMPMGAQSELIWSRIKDASGNWKWRGIDFASQSDTSLETPDIQVGTNGNFVVSFQHRHEFEFDAPSTAWDGAVIEITKNGGQTWEDVKTYVNPGYNGDIYVNSGALSPNPLEGRNAFVAKNPSHPAMDSVALDFKHALDGQTVRLRFRIGSDGFVGAAGWEIDNIALLWTDNKPFSQVVDDTGTCNGVPVANAGPDQTAMSGSVVQLNGSASSDPDNEPLTFGWTKTVGPEVNLLASSTAMPVFLAPAVATPTVMSFALSVSDGVGSAGDTVDVLVVPDPTMGSGGAGGGGMGGMGGGGMGGAGGEAGIGGAGGAMGGMGGTAGTASSSSSSSSTSSGGEFPTPPTDVPTPEGGCECTVAGADSAPVRPGLLGSLGLALGLLFRRKNRSAKN